MTIHQIAHQPVDLFLEENFVTGVWWGEGGDEVSEVSVMSSYSMSHIMFVVLTVIHSSLWHS